ncbi:unnamed protein product [Ceratitis capitata]|uniref:(Mediterranean fruit fly) hypothetical protein n=1 Tax=Ceratitis capitata TaxID=7213 RepID=A0A811VCR2_CERCA|nr:unnamed protein product [Ceratitis capitata]
MRLIARCEGNKVKTTGKCDQVVSTYYILAVVAACAQLMRQQHILNQQKREGSHKSGTSKLLLESGISSGEKQVSTHHHLRAPIPRKAFRSTESP